MSVASKVDILGPYICAGELREEDVETLIDEFNVKGWLYLLDCEAVNQNGDEPDSVSTGSKLKEFVKTQGGVVFENTVVDVCETNVWLGTCRISL